MTEETYKQLRKVAIDDFDKKALGTFGGIALLGMLGTLGLGLGLGYKGTKNIVRDLKALKARKKPYIGTNLNTPENEDIRQFNKSLMDQKAILESRLAGMPDFLKRWTGYKDVED